MYGRKHRLLVILILVAATPGSLGGQAAQLRSAQGTPRGLTVSSLRTSREASPHILPPTPSTDHPPPPPASAFTRLARSAGIIFAGTVTSISRSPAATGDAVATVSLTFHVEEGLRGARDGETLTIQQWMGLWTSGQSYRPGERVFVFLYPPSKLGLTSCIAGPLGRFRIHRDGRILLSEQQLAAFRADPVFAGILAGTSGGKSPISLRDFTRAVRHASGED